ncbi:pentatricopeptide repeat-containing protein At5g46580, chloroplastic [Silene latifolia]|uniref:pentatricopeptide repeat-containing protein At5g46580, chloroplastic n=1 Tax=Silene latifolia TaxID=37657 RepID=UPI003D7751A0
MSASFTMSLDLHCSLNAPKSTDLKHPSFFTKSFKHPSKKFTILCNNSSKSPPKFEESKKNPSLSEQLKPLSTTILSENGKQLLTKPPKSTWVNPTKPKPSVLSLRRHKRSPYSFNPRIRELKLFGQKLNDCGDYDEAFLSLLEDVPHEINRENALLLLNSLRPWEKTLAFFNWMKTRNLFPMETIFYNVTMKSLRFGRQFEVIEGLANEMIENEIALDNITYSTIISCAKRCSLFDKAVEWFERMYKTGVMPDEVTYSAVLDVYAKIGKVEEVMSLYERGRASGWTPDQVAFSVLCKMFGEAGDYDGIRFVLQEMKALGVQPNLVVYNTLLEAMGKAGKPGLARSLFEEMIESGVTPNEKTLTALVKVYGKARWGRDALELWERMRSSGWPMDFILYNTLLSMCADLGLEEEAEKLFEDMKRSNHCSPDGFTYTAMLNIYCSGGKVDRAMELFTDMSDAGVKLNVMGCTCLVQCLGRSQRIDDLVRIFEVSIENGIKPDDRLCGCLLSVVSFCDNIEDANKVLGCLEQSNPKLVAFISLIDAKGTKFETLKEEFKAILTNTQIDSRRPFCNCLIDICRKRNLEERAHELLYLGTVFGLYPGLHKKAGSEWSLNVRSLSVGAAQTAFEEWMTSLSNVLERQEALPELFSAYTGAGTHKFSQGLASAFASHVEELKAPFRLSEDKAGCFVATRDELVSWVQSRDSSLALTA